MCLDDLNGAYTVEKNYACFTQRLLSFKTWKLSSPTASDLAKSGFYYTNSSDIVTCFCCKIQLGQWNSTDIADIEHFRYSIGCKYLKLRQKSLQPIILHQHIDQSINFVLLWITALYIIILYLLFAYN